MVRKLPTNLINLEPWDGNGETGPAINVVTQRGPRLVLIIQKLNSEGLREQDQKDRYLILQQKNNFKDVVEMFQCISTSSFPIVVKKFKGLSTNPTSSLLNCKKKFELQSLDNSKKLIDPWFNLFDDILKYGGLIEKLWNTLQIFVGAEEEEELISANLP